MLLGEKIKKLRMDKGLSQESLANALGYTNKSTITRIENGTNKISYEMMKKFADFFDVSISYLYDDEDDMNPYSVFMVDLNGKQKVYHLNEDEFIKVSKLLESLKK